MKQIKLKARAKINLALDVVRKREDGYHDLSMIMQTIDFYDKISIKMIVANKIIIKTNVKGLPVNENNIVYKAAKLLMDKFDIQNGVFIYIEKHIPIGSGMAGGSTDAAATLKGMNIIFDLNLSTEELMSLGLLLGADVPYCILGGTALAKGVGEKLKPLKKMMSCFVLVAKPGISVSTKLVFTNLKVESIQFHPDIEGMEEAIEKNDYNGVISRLGNVLEMVTIDKFPIIGEIKQKLTNLGADGVLMSGSGSTVFGLFMKRSAAQKAYVAMRNDSKAKTVYLTKLYNN